MKNIISAGILIILTTVFFKADAQTVMLDYYFNHEVHTNKSGQQVRFHYMWEDTTNTGFSILGTAFKNNGAKLTSLDKAPTADNLSPANIYIIVDPDTKKESLNPNYIEEKDINEIVKWVKAGGVLVMLANDSANVELPHFNHLAARFGMHFNDDMQNHVIDDNHFQDGAIVTTNNPSFKTANKIFMKDVCSISLTGPAHAFLKNSDDAVVMAVAKYGKGTVFAVGDPWLYNEYTNGRLPAGYENKKAADDIAKWLIKQVH
ncbi:MAG: unsaturated rhamnogalacturonyl hydrolase [Mucilaginibacter sp.]|nr:unsaturated rhamnogalacturonyl hydrolase [Mucilaginibacter sp.]